MSKGFTHIELLIVSSIIIILSGILFLGRADSEKEMALQRAVYQLAQDLREVQEMAMAGQEIGCGAGTTNSFGIHFLLSRPGSYILFADCDKNYLWNPAGGDIKISRGEVFFEEDVAIFNLLPVADFSVVFEPPEPNVYINGNNWGQEAEITLQYETGAIKIVKINSAGRIEIE